MICIIPKEAGGRRQGAGGRRQEARGKRKNLAIKPLA